MSGNGTISIVPNFLTDILFLFQNGNHMEKTTSGGKESSKENVNRRTSLPYLGKTKKRVFVLTAIVSAAREP